MALATVSDGVGISDVGVLRGGVGSGLLGILLLLLLGRILSSLGSSSLVGGLVHVTLEGGIAGSLGGLLGVVSSLGGLLGGDAVRLLFGGGSLLLVGLLIGGLRGSLVGGLGLGIASSLVGDSLGGSRGTGLLGSHSGGVLRLEVGVIRSGSVGVSGANGSLVGSGSLGLGSIAGRRVCGSDGGLVLGGLARIVGVGSETLLGGRSGVLLGLVGLGSSGLASSSRDAVLLGTSSVGGLGVRGLLSLGGSLLALCLVLRSRGLGSLGVGVGLPRRRHLLVLNEGHFLFAVGLAVLALDGVGAVGIRGPVLLEVLVVGLVGAIGVVVLLPVVRGEL